MASAAITLSQISKVFENGVEALHDVNLSIRQGEFVTLVGPSGCGKSTLLRLIAGLGTLSSGAVEWGLASRDRTLSFVFQEAALMPWSTVVENIYLPLRLKGISRRASGSRIREALTLVGLEGWEKAYPRQLSGGMKMRVSIARALVTHPTVLLMDEPFGALDEMTRSRLNQDLLKLWETYGWTVIFVTHNIYEAVYVSQRVCVMASRPGRILVESPINAPYPRDESFRTSQVFSQYCREILHHLSVAEQRFVEHPTLLT